MIRRYAPKDITFEAVEWDGNNISEVLKFGEGMVRMGYEGNSVILRITESDGVTKIHVGDYVAKEDGEIYGISKELFEENYEAVE